MASRWTSLAFPSTVILSLFTLARSATLTVGPTAYISLGSASPFVTMKPCAQGCFIYNGVFGCNNAGFYDLGKELKCGCSPQNYCYCDKSSGAVASAYISSCVAKSCGEAFPAEVGNAIGIYDGYCKTANVGVAVVASSTAKETGVVGSSSSTDGGAIKGTSSITNPDLNSDSTKDPVPASTSTKTSEEKKGLSQSDILALGVGLGVGIPSLLLALGTFCLTRRNSVRKKKEEAGVGGGNKMGGGL